MVAQCTSITLYPHPCSHILSVDIPGACPCSAVVSRGGPRQGDVGRRRYVLSVNPHCQVSPDIDPNFLSRP